MRCFFNCFIGLFLGMCCTAAQAQNYPVYNSFYVNPFLYNPAEAITEYTEIYALHRQQWLSVEGAPVLSGLTFTTLLNESRSGIGGKISSYKRGLLTTTDLSLAYAYGIPTGQKSWLFFGLSGGAISNTIDLTKITDPNDPAIANYLADNIQPAASFGLLYRSASGINLGISLPQLFPSTFNSEANFSNTSLSPMDNVFVTLYYKRKLDGKMANRNRRGSRRNVKTQDAVAPLELYFNYKYSKFGNSQLEALAKLNVSQNFWVGASYRWPYGFTGNVGINTQRFLFGYSYEPGNQPQNGFSQGTHEVILGIKLGQAKNFKLKTPVFRSTLTKPPAERHMARFKETVEDPDQITHQEEAANKIYYVVIRSYNDFTQADAYKRSLIEGKFNAEVLYNPHDKKYHVHVLETLKAAEANEEVKNLKKYTKLKQARVIIVTKSK